MKKLNSHSRSSLFLMEMIISILFLSLVCAACVQIFALARQNRKEAREWNHIQELTSSVGEALEGWEGDADAFQAAMPSSCLSSNGSDYYFDRSWNPCTQEEEVYQMTVSLSWDGREKSAALEFSRISGESLYSTTIRYPVFSRKSSFGDSADTGREAVE